MQSLPATLPGNYSVAWRRRGFVALADLVAGRTCTTVAEQTRSAQQGSVTCKHHKGTTASEFTAKPIIAGNVVAPDPATPFFNCDTIIIKRGHYFCQLTTHLLINV